ncbi:MAG: hypothetical protein AAF645_07800 [Myxococcota bacterium]
MSCHRPRFSSAASLLLFVSAVLSGCFSSQGPSADFDAAAFDARIRDAATFDAAVMDVDAPERDFRIVETSVDESMNQDSAVDDEVERILAFQRAVDERMLALREACGDVFSTQGAREDMAAPFPDIWRANTTDVLAPRIRFLVAEHGMTLDVDAAAECLALELDCSTPFDEPGGSSPCERAYSGNFEAGRACRAQMDCAPELVCRRLSNDGGCGECAVPIRAGMGEACENGGCEAGLECGLEDSVCLSIATSGGACVGTFRTPFGDDGCPPYHACIDDVCTPFADFEVVGPGGPCANPFDRLVATRCEDGLICYFGRCLIEDLDEGESCPNFRTENPTRFCRPDLRCRTDIGICDTGVALGGACERSGECVSGRCSEGVCTVILQPSGSPCGSSVDCWSYNCEEGVCAPRDGDLCD